MQNTLKTNHVTVQIQWADTKYKEICRKGIITRAADKTHNDYTVCGL
jgi:hypothetical protein